MSKNNKSILVIGDLHAPVYHAETVDFLEAVKKVIKPTRTVLTGDEVNWESISYHEKNPDLPGARDELLESRIALKPIYELFPKVDVLESNHGDLPFRKAMTLGLPSEIIRTRREILGAPRGWEWHLDLTIPTSNGPVYFTHGKSSAIDKLSKNMAMSCVQGHFHSKFYVSYWANPNGLFFDCNAGSFADSKHPAMRYQVNSLNKGIMGVIVIENGLARPYPMLLNKKGKWVGKL